MLAYAAIPLACWLYALIAIPRRPRFGNEVEELVYARLMGQQRLILVAVVVSAAAFLMLVLSMPLRVDADLRGERAARWRCDAAAEAVAFCAERSAGGMWLTKQRLADQSWQVIGVAPVPPPFVPATDV